MSTAALLSLETSAIAAQAAIRRGDVSSQELTSHYLARIEGGNSALGAVRSVSADAAMQAARAIDELIIAGARLPPLFGVPVVVKENCDTAGLPCSAGLAFRAKHIPAQDSAITDRLRATGAIILGVSVSDPGAFGVRTVEVNHPADPALTVGGSSGGAAAALAARFCLGAIGTDTGGSIRIPSACCGTVGLKPSYGALPVGGVFPLAPSLDHVGPMARSLADVRLLWQGLAGSARESAKPTRVGFDPAWVEIADRPIRAAFAVGLERLKDQGVAAIEIALPKLKDIAAMHGRIFMVEAAAYHCAHYGDEIDAYPAIAREWFAMARQMRGDGYLDSCRMRVVMTRAVDELLQSVDAIVTPTLCVARPAKSAETLTIAGEEQDYIMALVRLTCLFNHTGHPVIALPIARGLDAFASSVQVVCERGNENRALQVASLLELGVSF